VLEKNYVELEQTRKHESQTHQKAFDLLSRELQTLKEEKIHFAHDQKTSQMELEKLQR